MAPEHKNPLQQGSLAPCKNNGAPRPRLSLQKRSTATSIAAKTRAADSHTLTSPHAAHRTALVRSFYPIFTPFLPPYYPTGTAFTPFLPRFYPRFYPVFTLFRRVKSRVYPKFTPVPRFLPQRAFYPNFSTYAPFLPKFYPRGKTGLFLLVARASRESCGIPDVLNRTLAGPAHRLLN